MSLLSERARAWLSLLIGPLLVLGGSALGARHSQRWWSIPASLAPGGAYRADALAHAAARDRSAAAVILGSSVALRDVDEGQLGRALGGEVLNLGVNGLSVAGQAMYAPRIARARPRLVLLVVGLLGLSDEEHPDWLRVYHPGVAWEVYGPRRIAGHLEAHLDGLLGWLNPLHRQRPGLRRYLEDGPYTRAHPRRQPPMPEPVLAAQLEGVFLRYAAEDFEGRGPNTEGLRAIHRRLSAAGVSLVVSPAPAHPRLTGECFPPTLTDALEALEAELNLELLPPAALGDYRDRDFVDPMHLGPSGQRRYTRALAEQLAERLD